MDPTTTQLVQLYAPFVGLIGLAFWSGALSARVRQLEKDAEGQSGVRDSMIKVQAQVEAMTQTLKALDRNMQGANRQLANIAVGRHGVATYFSEGEDR
jgi:hypothetical protein